MTTEIKNEGATPEPVTLTISENYEALVAICKSLSIDFEKFHDKSIKSAGLRVRNNLLNCRKLCNSLRKQVLNDLKALPIKHRTPKTEGVSPKGSTFQTAEPEPEDTTQTVEEVLPDMPLLVRTKKETPLVKIKITKSRKKARKNI